jgi:hypothetical protein
MRIQFELLSFSALHTIIFSLMEIVIEMENTVLLASHRENVHY